MPKSPCPPGQTRNRVTKACRDKKKAGRKPGTRKAKPATKFLLFEVFLQNNEQEFGSAKDTDTLQDMFKRFQNEYKNDDSPASKRVAKNAAKIIKWYKQFKADYKDSLKIKGIEHKHGNVFEIQYIGEDDYEVDSYLDSDEDGNHPITIDGVDYLISGERIFDDE